MADLLEKESNWTFLLPLYHLIYRCDSKGKFYPYRGYHSHKLNKPFISPCLYSSIVNSIIFAPTIPWAIHRSGRRSRDQSRGVESGSGDKCRGARRWWLIDNRSTFSGFAVVLVLDPALLLPGSLWRGELDGLRLWLWIPLRCQNVRKSTLAFHFRRSVMWLTQSFSLIV